QGDLGIGGLAAIIETESPANADRARSRLVLSQRQAANVDNMHPVIAHLAIAGIPEPVPFVMQLVAHQRAVGSRTAPAIIVYRGRHSVWRRDFADACARSINQGVRETDRPELAVMQLFKGAPQQLTGTILRADLDHAPVLAGGGDHLLTFPEVVGKGFFDI